MRALVTGGAGFIGSMLVGELVAQGAEVLVVDDLSVGTALPAEHPRVRSITSSTDDPDVERSIVEFAPDTVFHLAALHFIPWCERNPRRAHRVNVAGTGRLLDVLDAAAPGLILFASSVAVYGFHEDPVVESMPHRPHGVYARTKTLGERLLRQYATRHPECSVTMPRLANVYGPGDPNDHLIPALCRDIGGEITVGNLWPLRDYVHVSDVVSAMLRLVTLPPGVHAYNVGTGVGTTVDSIVRMLTALSGTETTLRRDPARERDDDGHLVADASALARATGWCPSVTLEDGLTGLLRATELSDATTSR